MIEILDTEKIDCILQTNKQGEKMNQMFSKIILLVILMCVNFASAYVGVGRFVTITPKDPVKGIVSIQPDRNGDHYLLFKNDFETVMAPDLRVILHKEIIPQSYNSANSIDLAPLAKIKGQQIYKLPKGIDIKQFQSIIVWCRQFNVTFGTAALIELK